MPEEIQTDWEAARKRREEKAAATRGTDWEAARERREARESAEGRGTFGDIISGAVRSVAIQAPSMSMDVLKATERIGRRLVGLPEEGPIGAFATETKEDIQEYAQRSPFLRAKEAPGIIAQGVEAAGQSLTMGVPGALAGFGIGSLGGPLAPITAPMAALVGFALSGGITFGLAEYQNVIDMADKEDIKRSESEPAAIISGIYEGGFEFLSDILTGGIMKVTKPLTTPAKEALKTGIRQLFKTTLKETMLRGAAVSLSETSMEMMTAGFQAEQYKKLGLGHMEFWEAATEAMGPAFVASVIFGGVFAGSAALHRRKIQRNIENGAVDPKVRMGSAAEVEQILKGIDPNLAETWRVNSAQAIKESKDIEIDKTDIITASVEQRSLRRAMESGKAVEDITQEDIDTARVEVEAEIKAEEQEDTKRYITAGIGRSEIDEEQAQAIGRNKDIPMQEVNQAIMDGLEIEDMILKEDVEGLTQFAKDHELKIPWRVKHPENLAFLVSEHLEEDGSEAVMLAGQIANLEETATKLGQEEAAENLAAKTEELNKMMPGKEEVVEDDRAEGEEVVREEPRLGEEPGEEGRLREPEVSREEAGPGEVLPRPEAEIEGKPAIAEKPAAPVAAEAPIEAKPIEKVAAKPEEIQPKELYKVGKTIPALAGKPLVEEVRKSKVLQKADVGLSPEGHLWWRNKKGAGGKIMSVDHISPDKAVIKAIFGDIDVKGIHVEGKTEGVDITLNRDIGNRWTIVHEMWHVAKNLGLITKLESSTMDNKVRNAIIKGKTEFLPKEMLDTLKKTPFKDMAAKQQEDIVAYYVQDSHKRREGVLWQGGTKAAMQRIADFVDMLVNKFVKPTARGVVRSFEKGEVLAREAAKEAEAGEQFAIQAPKTPEFKKWFGKSAVRDSSGKPRTMFHGTQKDITSFQKRLGLAGHFGTAEAADDRLVHVSEDKYGKVGYPEGSRVMPVFLSMEKPVEMTDVHFDNATEMVEDLVKRGVLSEDEAEATGVMKAGKYDYMLPRAADTAAARSMVRLLKKKGYDGIMYENRIEDPGAITFIPFESKQVKSAFTQKPTEDPRIQYAIKKPTEIPEFKKWFKGSKVVDEKGNPKVIYHGTTHVIEAFDRSKGNVDNHLGAGFYFTDDIGDATEHYAGEGPDLTQRIDLLAERIQDTYDVEEIAGELGVDEDLVEAVQGNYEGSRQLASEHLKGEVAEAVPVYVKITNPFMLEPGGGTLLEIERDEEYYNELAEEEVDREDYEDEDDYKDALREKADDIYYEDYSPEEAGEGVLFRNGIIEAGLEMDQDGHKVWGDLMEHYGSFYGQTAQAVIDRMKQLDSIMYMDGEKGELVGNEFIRMAIEKAGYDGIIMDAGHANQAWRMGIGEGTTHYIAFEPTQIKHATDNIGTFDEQDPRIMYSIEKRAERIANNEELAPVGFVGNPRAMYALQNLKWKISLERSIYKTLNSRMQKELEFVEKLFGERELATITAKGKRTITPHNLGTELFKIRDEGVMERYIDDSIEPETLADERGFKGKARKDFLFEVKRLRSGHLYGDPKKKFETLSDNRKAGISVDFLLGTCQPSESCRVCYAAAGMNYPDNVRKGLRNTVYILADPQAWANKVAKEVATFPQEKMPFVRLLGSGDLTTDEQIKGFNALAKHELMDRPIHIFSRHHDNLAKLKGTKKAPFLKMASVDAHLYDVYGLKKLKNNPKLRGIVNAFLYTNESEIPQLEKLYAGNEDFSGTLGLILSVNKDLHDTLPNHLQAVSCPCDAKERSFIASCRQCALSQAGCFMGFMDKAIDPKGKIWNVKDAGMPKGSSNMLSFVKDVGDQPTGRGMAEAAATLIRATKKAARISMNDFKNKNRSDIRLTNFRQPDDTITVTNVESAQAFIDYQDGLLQKALVGDFDLPGGPIQAARSFEAFKEISPREAPQYAIQKGVLDLGQEVADRWYSKMQKFLGDKLPGKGPPGQMKTMVSGWAKKGQFRKEELDWSGLQEWLDEQTKKTVTKQEVLDYLVASNFRVEEVMLGGPPATMDPNYDFFEEYDVVRVGEGENEFMPDWRRIVDPDTDAPYGNEYQAHLPEGDFLIYYSTGTQSWTLEQNGNLIESGFESVIAAKEEVDSFVNAPYAMEGDIGFTPDHPEFEHEEGAEGATKHARYVQPGGKRYRELLITIPTTKGDKSVLEKEFDKKYGKGWRPTELTEEEWQRYATSRPDIQKTEQYTGGHYGTEYPGTMLHVRFDERTGPDGKKILHIAEIQSDLHQEARGLRNDRVKELRDESVAKGMDEKEALAKARKAVPANYGYKRKTEYSSEVIEAEARRQFNMRGPEGLEWEGLSYSARRSWYQGAEMGMPGGELTAAVPDAPFKQTQAWQLLAIKRMVRYAAENDFDMISWDPGAVQAERYKEALRQRVDSINWTLAYRRPEEGLPEGYEIEMYTHPETRQNMYVVKSSITGTRITGGRPTWEKAVKRFSDFMGFDRPEGTVRILATKGVDTVFNEDVPLTGKTTIAGKEVTLDRLIGKELAGKIRESKERKGHFKGEDLTIGGEGMKGFYDVMLPDAINKFFNKPAWGKAKVGTTYIDTVEDQEAPSGEWEVGHTEDLGWFVVNDNTDEIETGFSTEELADERAGSLNLHGTYKAQALPITPEMKEKALYEGMPMFALKSKGKERDTIGGKIVDDIAFKPRAFDFTKDDARDAAAKMYHLFIMKEYPIVRLAKKAGDKQLEMAISKQIRRRRGESGMTETILTSENIQEATKALEEDGITEYRHITDSLANILSGLKSEAMYRDYERMRVYERDLALAKHRPDPKGLLDSVIKGVNKRKAEKVLGFLKEKYGETPNGRVLGLSEISDRHREFERQAILMPLVESGWLSQEQYDNITGRPESEYYASFLREMEEDETEMVGRGKELIKKIYGSERKKLPSTEGTIANLTRAVKIVEEQRLNKQILQIRDLSPDFEEMIAEIPPSFRPVPGAWAVYEQSEAKTLKRAKRVFATESEAQMFAAGLSGSIVVKRPGGSVPVQYRPEGAMVVAEEGKKTYYSVPKDVAKALDTHTPAEIHSVMRILGAPARLLRAGATLSAEFIMRNPVRDQFSAFVYSKYGYNMSTDFARGVFTLIAGHKQGGRVLRGLGFSKKAVERGRQMYDEFKASGGEMAYFVSLDRQKINMKAEQITGYKKGFKWAYADPIEGLRVLSEVMEKGTRLGLYTKAKAKGATPGEAMTEARGATLDFGRIGQIRALNQVIAFWNANVQGTSKMRQEIFSKPQKERNSILGYTLARATLGITVPSIILWAINHDDERYKKLPEWQKNFFWIFPVGTDGPIIRIPKPFELGLIFGSLPERILDYLYANDVEEIHSIATAIKDGAMPGLIPTAALPLIEHLTNYSFFRERRLESQAIQRLPVEMRYTPFTTEAAKKVGALVKLSPVKLENWIRDWTGSLGYTAIGALDPLLESRKIPEVGKKWYEVTPGIRGFIARDPRGSSSKTTNKFYDYLEKAAQTQAGHKLLLRSNQAEAVKYFEKNRVHITSARRARSAATLIAQARKQQYLVMASMKSSEQKRREIDEINLRISNIAEQFNKWYKGRGG